MSDVDAVIQPGNGLPFMPLTGYTDMNKDVYSWLSKSEQHSYLKQQQERERQLSGYYETRESPKKFIYSNDIKSNIVYDSGYHSNYKASDV